MPILLTVGIGGIGKTELAKHFFLKNQNNFNKLAWIKYTDSLETSFCTGFKIFENIKDNEQRYKAIIEFLSKIEGNNLLVIDDISQDDRDIPKLTATLPNFKVIGTSRQELDGFEPIYIDVLESDDAIELFIKRFPCWGGD